MAELLTSLSHLPGADPRSAVPESLGNELLDGEVCDYMTPGCVSISEDTTVAQAAEALAARPATPSRNR
jgi:hypothetical protein